MSPQAKLEYDQKLENLKRVSEIIVPMENHPRKRDMFRIINTGVFQICSNRVQVLQKITDFTKILTESKADDVVHNYCLNLMAQKFLVSISCPDVGDPKFWKWRSPKSVGARVV